MTRISHRLPGYLAALLVAGGLLAADLPAQTPPVPQARLDTRRAQATRAELEASLVQIDSILNSPGYSSRIRETKRREANLIRQRLTEGDLLVGDSLTLTVLNEPNLSGSFQIGSSQTLAIPGLPEIAVRGVLRSEARDYLAAELAKYVRDPSVQVRTSVRLGMLGAVGRRGYYQVPADQLISDAIMAAGGLAGSADPNRTEIKRSGSIILSQEQVREAIGYGRTIDQLNLRAGDEIYVDPKQVQRRSTISVLTVVSLATTAVYMMTRIF